MRLRVVLTAGLVAVVLCYVISPFVAARELGVAAGRGDVEGVAGRVDLVPLRRSLTKQLIATYLERNSKSKDLTPFRRGLAVAIGSTLADPFVEELLTPANLSDFLAARRPHASLLQTVIGPEQAPPPLTSFLRQGLRILTRSEFTGPSRFKLILDADGQATGDAYALHFILSSGGWKLAGLDLPLAIKMRAVEDIEKRQRRDSSS